MADRRRADMAGRDRGLEARVDRDTDPVVRAVGRAVGRVDRDTGPVVRADLDMGPVVRAVGRVDRDTGPVVRAVAAPVDRDPDADS